MKRLWILGVLFLLSCPRPNLNLINYLGKGYEAYQKGDFESAEKFFRSAVKSRPRDPIAYNNLGVVLMDLDRTDESIQYFKFATVLSKTPYAAPHTNLAKAYLEQGKLDLAKQSGEKSMSIDGANPVCQLVMANVYCAKNENLQSAKNYALSATQKISEVDRAAAWSTLAEAEYKLRNIEAAMSAIDTAISLDTDNTFYRQQKILYKP